MEHWKGIATRAMLEFAEADACDTKEIMRIQNDLVLCDMIQTSLEEAITSLHQGEQLGVIEGDNAAGDD